MNIILLISFGLGVFGQTLYNDESMMKTYFETQESMIETLTIQISKIEKEIDNIITSSERINQLYTLITSIKSVGRQTALHVIVSTHGFTKFNDSRHFASYSGIAPFDYQSGTSIKGKTKVSNLANKKMKSLLDMCAVNAIKYNQEMKIYYERKTKEGKHSKSVINAVRNKLLSRIFAVVKRNTPYVDCLKFAA